jgi:hypothetical protein
VEQRTSEASLNTSAATDEPPGGCAAHGVALLLASAALVAAMAAITFGCWLLYRLAT